MLLINNNNNNNVKDNGDKINTVELYRPEMQIVLLNVLHLTKNKGILGTAWLTKVFIFLSNYSRRQDQMQQEVT